MTHNCLLQQAVKRGRNKFLTECEEKLEMLTPRTDGAVTLHRNTVQSDNAVPTTNPPLPVITAEDSQLWQHVITEGLLLTNDTPPQNSTLIQNETNQKTRPSIRLQTITPPNYYDSNSILELIRC